jgi:hypothetical protein
MGRDLGPNPARYNGPCRPGTKLFRAVPCLGRAFFFVLRAGPSDPAQMYTYIKDYRVAPPVLGSIPLVSEFSGLVKKIRSRVTMSFAPPSGWSAAEWIVDAGASS